MGTAQAAGVAILAAARRGHPGRPAHAQRGQGGRHRQRHGPARPRSPPWSPGCSRCRQRPSPADAADALALAICHLWRGSATVRPWGWGSGARPRPSSSGWRLPPKPDDGGASLPGRSVARASLRTPVRPFGRVCCDRVGTGAVLALRLDGAVIEVGGVGLLLQCTPATLAGLRFGVRGRARHLAGGAGGLADPVRLRRRRRARRLRGRADRLAGWGRGWRWRCSPSTRPTRCVAPSRRRT